MFYFIRHAQSRFNFEADMQLKEKLGDKFNIYSEEYINVKFDPKYFDCGLTEVGKEQCIKPRE